jgi:hypothetical protein
MLLTVAPVLTVLWLGVTDATVTLQRQQTRVSVPCMLQNSQCQSKAMLPRLCADFDQLDSCSAQITNFLREVSPCNDTARLKKA